MIRHTDIPHIWTNIKYIQKHGQFQNPSEINQGGQTSYSHLHHADSLHFLLSERNKSIRFIPILFILILLLVVIDAHVSTQIRSEYLNPKRTIHEIVQFLQFTLCHSEIRWLSRQKIIDHHDLKRQICQNINFSDETQFEKDTTIHTCFEPRVLPYLLNFKSSARASFIAHLLMTAFDVTSSGQNPGISFKYANWRKWRIASFIRSHSPPPNDLNFVGNFSYCITEIKQYLKSRSW